MNNPSSVETHTPVSLKETLFKVVPESAIGRVLFWGTLPALFFFLTIGVSFLSMAPFSPYLPFLALMGGLICVRWKTIGLGGSYLGIGLLLLAFYREIPLENRLWQMSIVFTLAVDYFILLLAVEEIEATINRLAQEDRVKTKHLYQSQLQLQQLNREWSDTQKSLEEEIKELKEAAEQRRLEKQQECKRIELIQSEIELLTSQKTYFVSETKEAVAKKEQSIKEAEELETCLAEKTEELTQAKAELAMVQEKLTSLQQYEEELTKTKAALAQEKNLTLEQQPVSAIDSAEIKQKEGMYKQLRSQFDEKTRILSQTRKELFQAQSKLLAMEHEQHLSALAPERQEAAFFERELNYLLEEIKCLEEDVHILEELISLSSSYLAS